MNIIDKVLNIAKNEIGYKEGANNQNKYCAELSKFYNNIQDNEPWCNAFISWCILKAYDGDAASADKSVYGSLEDYTVNSLNYFKNANRFFSAPKVGSLIYFDNNNDGIPDHIGIVYKITNALVYTYEGNSNNAVRARSYKLTNAHILGYGYPAYIDDDTKSVSSVSYRVGSIYSVVVNNLNVRSGPSTSYPKRSRSALTLNARQHSNAAGQLKKGTRVTCKNVAVDIDNNTWLQIPSGWICAIYGSSIYVK